MTLTKRKHKRFGLIYFNAVGALTLGLCVIFLNASNANSSDTEASIGPVKSEIIESRLRIGLNTEVTNAIYLGSIINGAGIGVSGQYALAEKWGLIASFNQEYYISGLAPLYSGLDLRGIYALSGSLISKRESISIGSNEVLKSQEYQSGGLRLTAQSDLFFFNSIASVIPFTGIGFAVIYEFPSSTSQNLNAGARMDFVSNSTVNLTPLQLFFGILF